MPHPQKQQSSKATAKLGEKYMHTHTHTHTHTDCCKTKVPTTAWTTTTTTTSRECTSKDLRWHDTGAETTVRRFACTCGTLRPEKPQDHSRPSKTHLSPKKKNFTPQTQDRT